MGTPTLATAQWTALWRLSQQGPLAVAPVRISLGLPRFWGEAKRFPYVAELAPRGLFGIADSDEFDEAYTRRLDQIGVDRIAARLDAVADSSPQETLALCCFEPTGKPCHRRTFARWWHAKTGIVVPEIDPQPRLATR